MKNFKKTLKGIICGLSASVFLTGCGVGNSIKEKQDDKDAQIIEMQLEIEEQKEKIAAEMQLEMEEQKEKIVAEMQRIEEQMQSDIEKQSEIIDKQSEIIARQDKEIERLTQEMNSLINSEESLIDSKTETKTEEQNEERLKEETNTFKNENINYVDEISKYLFGENYDYDTVEELVVAAPYEGVTDEYLPASATQIHYLGDIIDDFPELTMEEINKIILNDILGNLHHLKTLYYDPFLDANYTWHPAEELNMQLYKNIAGNKDLEHLHLSCFNFSVKPDEFQNYVSKLQNLTTVDIQSCIVEDLNWISLLKNLNTVILYSPMTATDKEPITNLDGLADCQSLTTVIVEWATIENIDALYNFPNLTYIGFRNRNEYEGSFQIIDGVMVPKDQENTPTLRRP